MKSATELLADITWFEAIPIELREEAGRKFCLAAAAYDCYRVVNKISAGERFHQVMRLSHEFEMLIAAHRAGIFDPDGEECRRLNFEYLAKYIEILGGKIKQILSGERAWPLVERGNVIVIYTHESGSHAAYIPVDENYSKEMIVSKRITKRDGIWPHRDVMDVIEVEWAEEI